VERILTNTHATYAHVSNLHRGSGFVPSGFAYPITAHNSWVCLTSYAGKRCGGTSNQNQNQGAKDFFFTEFPWGVLLHNNSLTPRQLVSSQRRAARCDVSSETKQFYGLVTVRVTPHTYTHLKETLWFFKFVCSPPILSCRVDWDYVNRSASLNNFGKIEIMNCKSRGVSCRTLVLQASAFAFLIIVAFL